jgi:predicted polyphosphate/ATP-dependent NAD kinase
MRIGIIVNPDAGLGGRLGFKGSDGRAKEAREAGAIDRAGPRMQQCISNFKELLDSSLNRMDVSPTIVAWSGRMGGDWLDGFEYEQRKESPTESTAQDTSNLVHDLLKAEVDVILYAGGDGTTRDIVNALNGNETPLIGVPGGVKMHSGCFATTPRASAEVLLAFLQGDLMVAITEVMDLDEEIYQKGEWKVRMYGEAWTPSSPRFMQGAKEQVERASESETIEGLANHIGNLIEDEPELMVIWGSGGTLRRMGEHLDVELTLLGIDIQHRGVIHSDLNEQQLLHHLKEYEGPRLLLLSPMGGQGFLIGRGNLQLSPDVLRAIGFQSILGVATPSKLLGLSSVRIDTGDPSLDEEYQQRRFIKLLQGYRTTRVIRILES